MPALIRNITPNKISGLNVWLKPESLSGYTNGANLTSWVDSSGNGYNFVNGAGYPTVVTNFISGSQGISYNVGSFSHTSFTYMQCSTSVAGNFYNNFTVFSVTYQTSPTSQPSVFLDKGGNNYKVNGWYIDTGSLILNNSSAVSVAVSSPQYTYNFINNWKVQSWIVQTNGSIQGWMNGVANNTSSSAFTATSNISDLSLGAYSPTQANVNFGGYIAEIIIYNTALTTIQRQDIENYLRFKFQI